MSLVPVTDRFEVLDADHIADGAGIEQGFEGLGVARVAQHVTHPKEDIVIFGSLDNARALGLAGGHRLFQQYSVFLLGKGHRRVGMH